MIKHLTPHRAPKCRWQLVPPPPKHELRNSTGRNAVIASGVDEAAARAAAKDAAPDGETKIFSGWTALELSATDDVAAPIFIDGEVAEPLQRSRGL